MKDSYKIFRELEERNKRANPYKFYDKDELIDEILKDEDELIDEILKDEDEIERLNNIINELEHDFESYELEYLQDTYQGSLADFIETELERIQELKGSDKE